MPAWVALALAIAGAVSLLHGTDRLARLEGAVAESRARLLAREVESDIVIVGIDSRSLQALDEWPWPRRYHARLLQLLERSAPAAVFLDIDFSSRSSAQDDALFEKALAEWSGAPVLLASHFQQSSQRESAMILTRPLPRFARHAREASVVLRPDADGLVRDIRSSWRVGGEELRSVVAHRFDIPPATSVPIDYSILPSSFGYVSYSDVLNARVDPDALQGKRIYVGATAVELRDELTVPVHRTLPGVVVQALAAESVRPGVVATPPGWLYYALLASFAAGSVLLMGRQTWRRNAVALGAALVLLGAASVYLYWAHRVDWHVVPFAIAVSAAFVVVALRSLDAATWRAIAYAMGLRRREALLKSIVDSSTDAIVCIDDHGRIRTANPAACRLFALTPDDIAGASLTRFIPDLLVDAVPRGRRACDGVTEHDACSAEGSRFNVEVALNRVAIEEERLYTAVIRDVSERKRQQRQLEYQATHDSLTGLPNRAALQAHLEAALADASPGRHVALLLLDLGRFKEVNDTLGHDVGDRVLSEVAARFEQALAGRAFVARIGGDEFTVVLPDVANRAVIDDAARRLLQSVQQSVHVRGIALEIGVSIGVALAPEHARDAGDLLRHADVAMYVAKRRGSLFEYYDREHDRHTVRRLSMMGELRSAIADDGIGLYYQPQVDLATGRAVSVEALMRWHHPMLGDVSPAEFVTLAESTNLIRPLTDWSIERALEQARAWRREGLELRVAVNLSARVLQDVEFPRHLRELLRRHEADPRQLELEITESAMMLDPQRAHRCLGELHALGVLISIDDYGTGFSSLSYLRDLPVHTLKLDQSFVTGLDRDGHDRVIVESTVRMAHALDLEIVAEGVETQAVAHYLRDVGYDLAQGFLYTRPLPARECEQWILARNAGASADTASAEADVGATQSRRLG